MFLIIPFRRKSTKEGLTNLLKLFLMAIGVLLFAMLTGCGSAPAPAPDLGSAGGAGAIVAPAIVKSAPPPVVVFDKKKVTPTPAPAPVSTAAENEIFLARAVKALDNGFTPDQIIKGRQEGINCTGGYLDCR